MTETRSSQILSALLANEADDLAPTELTAIAGSDNIRPPTLDARTEMFLQAIYGPNCSITPEIRMAARNRLLSAMAEDLAEQTAGRVLAAQDSVSTVQNLRPRIDSLMSDAFSQIRSIVGNAWNKVLSCAAELFTSRGLRTAAVPLVALLVIGSAWSVSWINGNDHSTNSTLEASNNDTRETPQSRGLGQSVHPVQTEQSLEREIAVDEAALGPSHPIVARKLVDLANLYRSQGRYREAEVLCTRALDIQQQTLGPKNPETIRTIKELAMVYQAQRRNKEADDLLARTHRP